MLKFEAGAKYPFHNHPGGEEVFILEGTAIFNDTEFSAGDYLYTPEDFKLAVHSPAGCVMLLIVHEELRFYRLERN